MSGLIVLSGLLRPQRRRILLNPVHGPITLEIAVGVRSPMDWPTSIQPPGRPFSCAGEAQKKKTARSKGRAGRFFVAYKGGR